MVKDGGLRNLFHQHLKSAHWQTMELGLCIAGVPDSNYCIQGLDAWVEFKKTSGWAVSFKPAQIGWTERRCAAGGLVTIAVRRKAEGPRIGNVDELYLFDGKQIEQLSDEGIQKTPRLDMWTGGPRKWDWVIVMALLMRRRRIYGIGQEKAEFTYSDARR